MYGQYHMNEATTFAGSFVRPLGNLGLSVCLAI